MSFDLAKLAPLGERDEENDLHNLLAALVEQARAMASRMAGDPERETKCHFCDGPVPLWESLMVMQLAGVPAHVMCPTDMLTRRLKEAGPLPEFPYDDFSAAVDARMRDGEPPTVGGLIDS